MGMVVRTEINAITGQQIIEEINPEGESYTLEELYGIIGCDIIQVLHIRVDGIDKLLIADENGMWNKKSANKAATETLWESNPNHRDFTVLLGDIAFIEPHELQ